MNERTEPMDSRDNSASKTLHPHLPWVVAACAFVVYLATLNRWVSLASLPQVARVAGWDWTPQLTHPLQYLVTYPFRFLPAGVRAIALNGFAALCGALTLASLVRSVQLLPHDRTRDQRQRERSENSFLSFRTAWLPPLLAAAVCGFQLTFWEGATAFTGEMLDLLCFAVGVQALLEHRVDPGERWLKVLAVAYGVGMTNNWALIGFAPLFLVSLAWIKGRTLLDVRLLLRLGGLFLAGALLYFVMPLISVLEKSTPNGFWELVRIELLTQEGMLMLYPKGRVLLLSMTSLLPLMIIGFRWPSSFGDTSAAGSMLTNLMFRLVHGMFFAACLWVAFDPKFSPRQLGYGLAFLPLYFVGALCVGYFAGYFLLVCGAPGGGGRSRHRATATTLLINQVVVGLVWLAAVVVPCGLAWVNLGKVRSEDGQLLKEYVSLARSGLNVSKAAFLSDQSLQLLLFEAAGSAEPGVEKPVLIDTQALPYPAYQRLLIRRHPGLFPKQWGQVVEGMKDPVDQPTMISQLLHVSMDRGLYYLHPSFGAFFEAFHMRPSGLVYRMDRYETNMISAPAMTSAEVQGNVDFWKSHEGVLDRIEKLSKAKSPDAFVMGMWCSRSLNFLGAELQRSGREPEAARFFQRARDLNPENVAALVNLRYNGARRTLAASGAAKGWELSEQEQKLSERYRSMEELLAANGPFDEPTMCMVVGTTFAQGGLNRQAAEQFLRVQQLDPDNLQSRFWMGNLFLTAPLPDKTLEVVADLERRDAKQPLSKADRIETVRLKAMAYFGKGQTGAAEQVLLASWKQNPREDALLDTLFYIYFGTQKFADCQRVIQQQLEINPKNVRALLNLGATFIQSKDFAKAIGALDAALKLQPENSNALRNRAIAHLKTGRLDLARKDYESLLKQNPDSHVAHYGLGEIAFQQKDSAEAARHYERFLRTAPSGTPEVPVVERRLKELAGSR